jgi:hypothetical protein
MDDSDWDQLEPGEFDEVGAALFEQLGAGDVRAKLQSRADEIAELVGCEVGDATFERLLIALTVTFKITAGVLGLLLQVASPTGFVNMWEGTPQGALPFQIPECSRSRLSWECIGSFLRSRGEEPGMRQPHCQVLEGRLSSLWQWGLPPSSIE